MDKNNIGIIFVIIIVIFAVAFGLGYSVGNNGKAKTSMNNANKPYESMDTSKLSFEDGWNAAKQKLEESGLFPSDSENIKALSGQVTKTNGNRFEITSTYEVRNPLADIAPEKRTITVGPSTEIILQLRKDAETLEKERQEFEEKLKELQDLPPEERNPENFTPPERFIEQTGSADDIETGVNIIIQAIEGENIQYSESITPSKIIIQSR